jgi:methylmalonyl-CoA/ethylmalonyl-CoA epimerase
MTDAPRGAETRAESSTPPGTAIRINHVGVAVPRIDTFLERTASMFGAFSRGVPLTNTRQQVRELFLSDGAASIEVLEPLSEASPIRGFLRKNPTGGLVHLALDVVDLDAALARVSAAGGRLVASPVPDVAFGERRIAFVFIGGQLIELVEST